MFNTKRLHFFIKIDNYLSKYISILISIHILKMNTLQITKPNYTECRLNDKIIEPKIVIDNKLFHEDILNNDYTLKHSDRNKFLIGGVIKFHNKYTFGRNDKDMELFEFQPINWRYPKFLVASNIKRNLIKAQEAINDYLVVIKFKEWINKIPIGSIELNIGSVKILHKQYDILFYYYPTMPLVKPTPINIEPPILTPTIQHEIYSIDPDGCKDIDDALSYDKQNNRIGIHIADTDAIIESYTFNKCATIYAPHKNIPMFPENISNDLCSLLETKPRNVITCWINNDSNHETFSFETNIIQVTKNLSYDQAEKLIHTNDTLKILYEKSIILGKQLEIEVIDTHKMVEVYMVLYNREMAKHLTSNSKMIYRNQTLFKKATYNYNRTGHESLKLDYYTHASSPIRRYVDWIVQKLFKKKDIYIDYDDLEEINEFELKVNKLYRMWDYLKASSIIQNGELYGIELREIEEDRLVFFCEKLNIMIYNKIKYVKDISQYKIGEKYTKKLYLIEDKKNVLFYKILIEF